MRYRGGEDNLQYYAGYFSTRVYVCCHRRSAVQGVCVCVVPCVHFFLSLLVSKFHSELTTDDINKQFKQFLNTADWSQCLIFYGRTLSDASMLYFADVFFIGFFMAALVGQTAERIFTKLSHVVDISCYLRTY